MSNADKNPPPLLLVSKSPLSGDAIHNIQEAYKDYLKGDQIAIIEGMYVYQLIDGKWLPVTPSPPVEFGSLPPNAIILDATG